MRRTWFRVGSREVPETAVLRRDVVVEGDRREQFRRGTPLLEVLERGVLPPGTRVPVAVPTPGELAQHEASRRIAEAIVGEGTRLDQPHQGQVNIRAACFGVVRVSALDLFQLNRSGRVLVATVLDGRVTEADEVVAIAKVPGLFIRERELERTLHQLAHRPVVRVVPFRLRRVGLLAGERVRPAAVEVAARSLGEKLARFGAQLELVERFQRDHEEHIADRIREWQVEGIELVLTAGSIVLDPDDPFLRALRHLGAEITVQGAPVDPGTMFWVAYYKGRPLLGLASCELYGRISVFDLVLPYVLADERVDRTLFAQLAHGGLLLDTQMMRLPARWRSEGAEAKGKRTE